jgi:hypothetical protein
MTFTIALTKHEPVTDKQIGLGKDGREILVYRPEGTTDWIAEGACAISELANPQTRLVHIFQTVVSESRGMESLEGYVARMAEKSFTTMYDMDPLTNALHLAFVPQVVVVAMGHAPFDGSKDDIGRSIADSIQRIVERANKKVDKHMADDWRDAIEFCVDKSQSIMKAIAPLVDTSKPAQITLSCHRSNSHGHGFEELAPSDHIHAMLTLDGGLHHAVSWTGKRRLHNILIQDYFLAGRGLTVRDVAKPAIMTASRPHAHTVILNVEAAKRPALPKPQVQ